MLKINPELDELTNLFPQWPKAATICKTDDEKKLRAKYIIDYFIGENLRSKKVLDFGSSEDHVAQEILRADPAICVSTTSMEKASQNAPYDIILLYDVIDHVNNPNTTMKSLKTLMYERSRIFIRAHPWCSKHGAHIYDKAYIHLILRENELKSLGYNLCKNYSNMAPQQYYRELFKSNLFKQKFINIEEHNIEPFFLNNAVIKKRLMEKSRETPQYVGKDYFPEYQLKQTFVDFILGI